MLQALYDMGYMQSICPECGNVLSSLNDSSCERCKAKFNPNESEIRFVNIKWN